MTPQNRRSYAADLMALAAESMEAARKSLAMDLPKVAVSQSYYAMFHAATALLAARDIHRHRHGGVISAFAEQFCKTGDMEQRLGAALQKARGMRTDCDYKAAYRQSREGAEAAVRSAGAFLAAAEERLKLESRKLEGGSQASK